MLRQDVVSAIGLTEVSAGSTRVIYTQVSLHYHRLTPPNIILYTQFVAARIFYYLCSAFAGCSAVRLAHLLWEQGVAGSNPVSPTLKVIVYHSAGKHGRKSVKPLVFPLFFIKNSTIHSRLLTPTDAVSGGTSRGAAIASLCGGTGGAQTPAAPTKKWRASLPAISTTKTNLINSKNRRGSHYRAICAVFARRWRGETPAF